MTCRAQVSMERQIILLDELEKTIKTQTYMQTQTHTYSFGKFTWISVTDKCLKWKINLDAFHVGPGQGQ